MAFWKSDHPLGWVLRVLQRPPVGRIRCCLYYLHINFGVLLSCLCLSWFKMIMRKQHYFLYDVNDNCFWMNNSSRPAGCARTDWWQREARECGKTAEFDRILRWNAPAFQREGHNRDVLLSAWAESWRTARAHHQTSLCKEWIKKVRFGITCQKKNLPSAESFRNQNPYVSFHSIQGHL